LKLQKLSGNFGLMRSRRMGAVAKVVEMRGSGLSDRLRLSPYPTRSMYWGAGGQGMVSGAGGR